LSCEQPEPNPLSGRPTLFDSLVSTTIGDEIYALAANLYPICRSITGNGVRETLRVMGQLIPLAVREVPTGTQVFDWTIPREWNIRDAYIKTSAGDRIVDFAHHNLHVLHYSAPVRASLSLAELQPHLFSLPEEPDLIPYRTSYYKEQWGFCLPHRQREALREDTYEVVIDSELKDGALTWGEYLHRGGSDEEVLLTAHVCHPSLANDNCSALALLSHLAKRLAGLETRYTYRFLFAPGTIGSIAWLASNGEAASRIRHGLVLSCVGDGGGPTYKRSRRGNAFIDRTVAHVLTHSGLNPTMIDFSPYGYDERQFCSPGFNLPIGLFQRSQFGKFREYHTSADNLDFISATHLAQSYRLIVSVIDVLENERTLVNLNPKCEPQLGRRGLYDAIGGDKEVPDRNMAMLWVLNLSDGGHSLLDIAERSGLPFQVVASAADRLEAAGLLAPSSAAAG
jgi:aminopeptidase-like protein